MSRIPPPSQLSIHGLNLSTGLPACKSSQVLLLQAEVFRFSWIVGRLMSDQARPAIGSGLLKNSWAYHPALGSLQRICDDLSEKAKQLGECTRDLLVSKVQSSWKALEDSLLKDQVPQNFRSRLGLDEVELGCFSDTPLIVSDNGPDLPNILTLKELKSSQKGLL